MKYFDFWQGMKFLSTEVPCTGACTPVTEIYFSSFTWTEFHTKLILLTHYTNFILFKWYLMSLLFCGIDCNNFSHIKSSLLCFGLGMNIFAFQLPINSLLTGKQNVFYYMSIFEKKLIKNMKGNSLIFSLFSWSLHVSIAWNEEGKWQESFVPAAILRDSLRRSSYPVMLGEELSSLTLPFPLLSAPPLLPLLSLCGLSGITISCHINFSCYDLQSWLSKFGMLFSNWMLY